MVPRCAGYVDVSMHPMKCEAHSRNEAENLPFATNRLVKIDDLKAKIESDDESKNPRQKHLKAKLKAETFLAQSVRGFSGSPVLASFSHRVKVNFSKWA